MKISEFLKEVSEHSLAIKNWVESEAMDDELYVYFKDGEDLFFVFMFMIGPIYLGALTKILNLPSVKDVGISPTFDNDGEVIDKSYDLVIKLNEGIEDLEFTDNDQFCNCNNECDGCDNDEDDGECEGGECEGCSKGKKEWN